MTLAYAAITKGANMTVRECMTAHPVTVSPTASIAEAAQLMKQGDFRRLPVVDRGSLVGIVTDRDIKQAMPSDATSLSVWEIHFLIAKIQIREIMTKNPVVVAPGASLEQAAQLMLEHKIGGLPVVQDRQLVGVVTVTDVLRAFVHQQAMVA